MLRRWRGAVSSGDAPAVGAGRRFALVLVGPAWQELRKGPVSLFPAEVVREVFAGISTRSRYDEDRLASGAFAQ